MNNIYIKDKMKKQYSPLLYLSALGAGGIAVMFFAVINYTFDHGEGLANVSQVSLENLDWWKYWVFRGFEVGMVVFSLIHLFLSLYLLPGLIRLMILGYDFVFVYLLIVLLVTLWLFFNLLAKQTACWGQKTRYFNCE